MNRFSFKTLESKWVSVKHKISKSCTKYIRESILFLMLRILRCNISRDFQQKDLLLSSDSRRIKKKHEQLCKKLILRGSRRQNLASLFKDIIHKRQRVLHVIRFWKSENRLREYIMTSCIKKKQQRHDIVQESYPLSKM